MPAPMMIPTMIHVESKIDSSFLGATHITEKDNMYHITGLPTLAFANKACDSYYILVCRFSIVEDGIIFQGLAAGIQGTKSGELAPGGFLHMPCSVEKIDSKLFLKSK